MKKECIHIVLSIIWCLSSFFLYPKQLVANQAIENATDVRKTYVVAKLILDYLSEQAPKLYDLDWIAKTKAYQNSTSITMEAEVAYAKFLARKLQLQKQRASQILILKSAWLSAGTTAVTLGGIKGYEWCEQLKKKQQEAKDPSSSEKLNPDDDRSAKKPGFLGSLGKTISSSNQVKGKIEAPKDKGPKWWNPLANLLSESLRKIQPMDYIKYLPGIVLTTIWGSLVRSGEDLAEASFFRLGQRIISSCTYLLKSKVPIKDPYVEIEELYAKNYFLLKALNPQLLMRLKEKMTELRKLSANEYSDHVSYVEMACRLPLRTGVFCVDTDLFASTYQFYAPAVQEVLRHIALELCTKSTVNPNDAINFPFYFQGPPGVGKTYAANHITHVTGAPIYHVTLEGGSIQEIVGTQSEPGRLLTALTRGATDAANNCKNSVLFIDEFDLLVNDREQSMESRAILSFILKVLDPSNLKFFSPYLDCYVDLPKVVILAGNQEIRDSALKDRFQTVRFNSYEPSERWAIAIATIIPKLTKMYGFNQITEEDLAYLKQEIYKDTQRRGMRSVELIISDYFSKKRTQQQF